MCTIGYCKELKLLFKNRDKDTSINTSEEIVADNLIIAGRTVGADYFSWGMNKYGCAFVSAAINTPKWMQLLYDGKHDEAQKQYEFENEGLHSPMVIISKLLPDIKRVDMWIEALTESKLLFKGYNVLLADAQCACVIELYKDKRVVRELDKDSIITNHFISIKHGPKKKEDYPSTFRRLEYANKKIACVSSFQDVAQMVKPDDLGDRAEIWRDGVFKTISSSILEFQQGNAFYAKDVSEDYSRISFHDPSEGKVACMEGIRRFEMSRYIDLELYHAVERSHPFYIEMTEHMQERIREYCIPENKYRVLEIGAGTGLFTENMLNFSFLDVTALELDIECCQILERHVRPKRACEIIHGDAVTFCRAEQYDIVVSTFAHDHIHYKNAKAFIRNIKKNLKKGGIYLMGGEVLPHYSNMEEREQALHAYHGMIIERALHHGDYRLAQIEINALESGIAMIGDFKRHEEMFEQELIEEGFLLKDKKKIGPDEPSTVGGVFVYEFIK